MSESNELIGSTGDRAVIKSVPGQYIDCELILHLIERPDLASEMLDLLKSVLESSEWYYSDAAWRRSHAPPEGYIPEAYPLNGSAMSFDIRHSCQSESVRLLEENRLVFIDWHPAHAWSNFKAIYYQPFRHERWQAIVNSLGRAKGH